MEPEEYTKMYRLEESYWWHVGRRALVWAAIDQFVRRSGRQHPRILDLGCGTGAMSRELRAWGPVVSFDICPEALALTRARTGGRTDLCQGSAEALPFLEATFDCATALDVIEHVRNDDAAVASLFHALAPGGMAVITVPAYQFLWSPHDVALHHFRRYTAGRLRVLLEDKGFRIRHLTYVMTLLFPFAAGMRLAARVRGALPARAPDSALPYVPGSLNRGLVSLLRAESALAVRTHLPFGLSILAVAERSRA